jgi:cellulose synthase/poly-beta-1,6-N-acetylglucosamine synthase-like glycosyltransferase
VWLVAVALVSLALLLYTYVGYPVLIAVLARLRPVRVAADPDHTPMVSAIIPAYNVAGHLDAKLDSLLAMDYPRDRFEILVMSDGSTDGTDELLARRAAADERVRPMRSDARRGKPAGVNAMKAAARGEVLLMTDARQPLAPGALRALMAPMADPTVGCVSGNLVLEGEAGSGVYWRYENWIRKNEASFRSMVGVTGPIYAIRREDLPELPGDIILDDLWTPMQLRVRGKKVLFAPDAIARDQAFGDEREFGRKARTLAGNYQLFARMPGLLLPFANPSWFETFSHKLLRLACPWLLAALAVSTIWYALVPPAGASAGTLAFMRVLAAGQVLFHLGALAGARGGRLAGVARTFVVLNAAAVVGLWRYLRGAQRVTW